VNFAARMWFGLALVLALASYGGAGDFVRPLLAVAVAITLVVIALGLRPQMHAPPLSWIALLFLPLIAITAIQIFPLGWHHPWVSEDVLLLGATATTWSINPAATTEVFVWLMTLTGMALCVTILARGDRVRGLVEVILYVAVTSAVLGLCLALTGAPWPSADTLTKARGPFIYPNHAAAFWAALLPLAALLAHRRGGIFRWGAVAALALGVLLSASRGGILVASFVMLPLAFTLLPRRRRWWWAIGGTLAISAWLWVIGLGEVANKFDQLRGSDGVTLSGRVTIWQAAWPIMTDAGALGSGGGTTTDAYRRSGDVHFADALVNHLHSDPLEWWLEYGWVGMLIALAACIAAGLRLRPLPSALADTSSRPLVLGSAAGLLILGLHACADFIWHSPAIAVEGVLLLCVLALSGHRQPTTPKQTAIKTGRLRICCLSAACVLALGAWPAWRWTHSELLARDVERFIVARRTANLPLTGANLLDQARAADPASVRLAITQAWLARAADEPDAARTALIAAAQLAPGSASAWSQRALLAATLGDHATMATAIRRALVWAPAWPDVQMTALSLVAAHHQTALPPAQTTAIINAVLAVDRGQPPWFFPLAADVLGAQPLAERLLQAGPMLSQSAEMWLAEQGPLDTWLALRRKNIGETIRRSPPALALANDRLIGNDHWTPDISLDLDKRRESAQALNDAGLPVPAKLFEQLTADGLPWSRWNHPIDLLDAATRHELALILRTELHRDWARSWSDRLTFAERALSGDDAVVNRDSEPLILTCIAGLHPLQKTPAGISFTLQQRAAQLLQRWREWDWQTLPEAGRWSWWFNDGTASAIVDGERWTGLVVDGQWIGWVRGHQELAPLIGFGLHRVVLLTP
jgi:O-antigen ligase